MKMYWLGFAILLLGSTNALATDQTFSCGNMDGTILADFDTSAAGEELKVKWPTMASVRFEREQLFITPGSVLWSEIPGQVFTQWPYGVYIAKDKPQDITVIVSIVRPASAGGGGYDYEGTLSVSAGQNDPWVSALYCR